MKKKLICELCQKYETFKPCNLKKHKLVCLKRYTEAALQDDLIPQSSTSSSTHVNLPITNSTQNQSGRRDNGALGNFTCNICGRPHGTMANLLAHRDVHSSVATGIPTSLSNDFASIHIGECALQQHFCIYDLTPNRPCSDVLQFFQMSAEIVKKLIVSLSTTHVLQGRMILRARFFRIDGEGRQVDEVFLYFPSLPLSFVDGDGEHWYASHSRRIIELMDTFARNSSNLEFDCVERVQIKLTLRENVDGQGIFPLPPKLAKKRAAIINVDSVSECFKYALLSILHYNDVPNRSGRTLIAMVSGSETSSLKTLM